MGRRERLERGGRALVVPMTVAFLGSACGAPARETAAARTQPAAAPQQALDALLVQARGDVEAFFAAPIAKPFEVRVLPRRADFSAYAKQRWGMPSTECWMVAVGVATALVVLAPGAWKTDACEHDPADAREVRQILAHELVHVFHGQRCKSPEFDGMDDLGWFVEGLAVLASGQLDAERRAQLREARAAGELPTHLADAWSGKHKYAIAGSLVAYVDKRWGRAKLMSLLAATRQDEILSALGTTEAALLADWRASLE